MVGVVGQLETVIEVNGAEVVARFDPRGDILTQARDFARRAAIPTEDGCDAPCIILRVAVHFSDLAGLAPSQVKPLVSTSTAKGSSSSM